MPTTGPVQKAAEAAAVQRDERATTVRTLRQRIIDNGAGFADALPEHISKERFVRAALTAINTVPRLADCTDTSVIAGLMQAAQLGLEVSDVRGQCFLIPRRDTREGVYKATFQLGYRGMIDLAARSGITVDAEELHANDEYDFALGTHRYLHHRPTLGQRGVVVAYYATATFPDKRAPAFNIMGVEEVEMHRDRFASTRNNKGEIVGPWRDHFDAMARKTVIRALLNYLPVSVELREAMEREVIETTAHDVRTPPPAYVGPALEEAPEDIDQMTVVDTTADDVPPDAAQPKWTTPPKKTDEASDAAP